MPYSVEIWLIVSEKVNDVMEQSEQDLPLWAKLKEQRLNREQSALAEKKTALAEKEAIRAEKKTALAEKEKKHLAKLDQLAQTFSSEAAPAVAILASKSAGVSGLLAEIGQASGQISSIVGSLKTYSYLDQAPVQTIDVSEGVDSSLLMLRGKLKQGVTVHREYAENLPSIQAYGSELNQVWTNIIDNAVDAMNGYGELAVRIYSSDNDVIVELEDTGPGIPEEIQHKIFDSFFTTKEPGKGTGLGLDITYNIIVHKHRGNITVLSEPGKTCFQITLPIEGELAAP